jgi:hypothetical protein
VWGISEEILMPTLLILLFLLPLGAVWVVGEVVLMLVIFSGDDDDDV